MTLREFNPAYRGSYRDVSVFRVKVADDMIVIGEKRWSQVEVEFMAVYGTRFLSWAFPENTIWPACEVAI